jgi:hypothetical protein
MIGGSKGRGSHADANRSLTLPHHFTVAALSIRHHPEALGMTELVFEVTQEADGGYCAECLTESIFTEGDTWDSLTGLAPIESGSASSARVVAQHTGA